MTTATLLLCGVLASQGWAESLGPVIRALEERLNSRAVGSISGQVDFEFAYVRAGHTQDAVLLEEAPGSAPTTPAAPEEGVSETAPEEEPTRDDTASHQSAGDAMAAGAEAQIQETMRDSTEAYHRNMPRREILRHTDEAATTQPPIVELPDDLQTADVAALKERLSRPVVSDQNTLLLGVRAVKADPRYVDETLTLADEELSVMERRFLVWDAKQIWDRWPTGSLLHLETDAGEADGEVAEIPLHWSFRRPGAPPFDNPKVMAEGEFPLVLKRRDGEWKVSHIEVFVAQISGRLVSAQRNE